MRKFRTIIDIFNSIMEANADYSLSSHKRPNMLIVNRKGLSLIEKEWKRFTDDGVFTRICGMKVITSEDISDDEFTLGYMI